MEFLASDALNGRASGSRDEQIAATYVGAQFRLWGLDPVGDNGGFVQQVEMAGAQASAPPVLRIGTNAYTHGKEMLVTALGTLRASGPIVRYQSGARRSCRGRSSCCLKARRPARFPVPAWCC